MLCKQIGWARVVRFPNSVFAFLYSLEEGSPEKRIPCSSRSSWKKLLSSPPLGLGRNITFVVILDSLKNTSFSKPKQINGETSFFQ